jgi:hypothetical protein
MSYNGIQNAGTLFNTVGFNVWYPSTNTFPTIVGVIFNGKNVCSAVTAAPVTSPTFTQKSTTKAATSPTSMFPISLNIHTIVGLRKFFKLFVK